ncbi:putative Zn-finger protein [Natronospira proteinivora]|uniref:Zn-finger protein n=2 Tax=Natronospira proteinivora TaxID=1807133 RepID=A0ABT1GCK5_9GAMM|nr:putative Zn-finger protein [Natronospira proteinivora]
MADNKAEAVARNQATPNDQMRYEVSREDFPVHCPQPSMSLWNSHPRVYIPVAEQGEARCPYCGALYVLTDR